MDHAPNLRAYEKIFGSVAGKNPAERLRALISLGLYHEAECAYARNLSSTTRSEAARRLAIFNEAASTTEAIGKLDSEAQQLFDGYSRDLIESAQRDSISSVVEAAESAVDAAVHAVHRSPRQFWSGVQEAVTGAFIYSLLLIGASIIINRLGIDLLEVYKSVAGIKGAG